LGPTTGNPYQEDQACQQDLLVLSGCVGVFKNLCRHTAGNPLTAVLARSFTKQLIGRKSSCDTIFLSECTSRPSEAGILHERIAE